MASHHLAFDHGASSGRALLGTVDDGRLETQEVHRFDTPLVEEGDRLYWGLAALEEGVDEGLQAGRDAAGTLAGSLASVSVDSWAVDTVPLGADGTPLRNPRSYRDPRTEAAMERALEQVGPEALYARTGIQLIRINTLFQVVADLEAEPDVVQETALRLFIADYVHYRLSGRAVAERSMASTSQLVHAETRDWDRALMEEFGIDPETWPEIVPPGTRLGPLVRGAGGGDGEEASGRRKAGDRDGEAPPQVVAGCTHDTACAVAAVPAEPETHWAYISCGTWSLVGVEREAPVLTEAAREAGFTHELGLDGTIRFLKNRTGLWVLQECQRVWAEDGQTVDYDALQAEADAASIDGIVDLDDPRFLERGNMPARLQAYCREQGQAVPTTRGEMARLVLRSLAADYRDTLALLEDVTGAPIDVVHIVGGGARNELLCRWTATACDRRVVAGPAEATALGNLLIQARTVGALPAGATIRNVVRTSADVRVYTPGR
jgi:rhamnulokinase